MSLEGRKHLLLGALTVALGAVSCGSGGSDAPPSDPFGCVDGGPSCGAAASTIINPGHDASADVQPGADSADAPPLQTATVTASVIRFADTDFSESASTVYPGAALVGVPGNTNDYFVGGDAGLEFTAQTLVGAGWFLVVPLGDPDLMTTHGFLNVAPEQTSIQIPVVDRALLSAAFVQAGTGVPLDSTAGQLILRFVDENGAPVSGVRITFSPFGGQNAFRMYDSGPGGSYIVDANSAGQTSTLGTVIIGNVTDGIGALSYRFNDVEYKTPDIMWVKPQATYARIRITGS